MLTTEYCPDCGEQIPSPRDLTVAGILHQLFLLFSSYDSRLLRSFRTLLLEPGKLTLVYLRGQRKKYIGPFQLFIISNVLLFAMQSFTNVDILTTALEAQFEQETWGATTQELVTRRLAATGNTLESYAPVFNLAFEVYAKSLIIFMALPFSLILPLMFFRNGLPFAAHVIFSLHYHTFFLLLYCLSLLIIAADVRIGGGGINSIAVQGSLGVANLFASAGYLYVATGTAYNAHGATRVIKSAVLALAVGFVFELYRFVICLITLYSTT
jgi:hypothetical protein